MRKSITTGVVLAAASTALFAGVANAASGVQAATAFSANSGDASVESPWPSVPVSGNDVN